VPFSVDRFLTTHTGSLPRPDDLVQMMYGKEEGKEVDIAALHKRTTTAVREVVDKQRQAIAAAMKPEYEAIFAAGFDLQVDCPDLAMGRHIQYASLELSAFRKRTAEHVEALNVALENIPPDRTRMHLCWGNYEGPHHCDVPTSSTSCSRRDPRCCPWRLPTLATPMNSPCSKR
jgi:methionine synthase II (cobalamin-independent)